jgi:hypothetical protein
MPGEKVEEVPSVRASLLAAVKEVETGEQDQEVRTGEEPPEGAQETPPEGEPAKKEEQEPPPEEEEQEPPPEEEEQEPPPEETPEAKAAKVTAEAEAEKKAKVTEPKLRAPASLSPLERQEFDKASPLLQKAMLRREEQITKALNDTAADRKLGEEYKQLVAPFEAMIRSENSTPARAIANLLSMSVAMRTAPTPHKVQLVANMIAQFLPRDEATLNMLNDAVVSAYQGKPLAGGGGAGGGEFRDPRFDQFLADLRQRSSAKQTEAQDAIRKHYETFAADPKHEYFHDVRPYMSALIAAEAERGVALSDEEAYERACELHPEVGPIVKQQKAAKAASKVNAKLQRSKDAGSSVRAAPVGQRPTKESAQPVTVADSIRQSIKQLDGKP